MIWTKRRSKVASRRSKASKAGKAGKHLCMNITNGNLGQSKEERMDRRIQNKQQNQINGTLNLSLQREAHFKYS